MSKNPNDSPSPYDSGGKNNAYQPPSDPPVNNQPPKPRPQPQDDIENRSLSRALRRAFAFNDPTALVLAWMLTLVVLSSPNLMQRKGGWGLPTVFSYTVGDGGF